MVDALAWRHTFGVIVPSTNTIVQPEFDAMRPAGVSNHISRIAIPNDPVDDDDGFLQLMNNIRKAMMPAIDSVMTCEPDSIVMGMSAETFWDGKGGAEALRKRLEDRSNKAVTMGSDAVIAALKAFRGVKNIAVITPYMPTGDEQVRRFFTDYGFPVVALKGLKCPSPVAIAQVSGSALRSLVRELDSDKVDAIVQCGTNLCMAVVAAEGERWIGKPVIAINTATYWHALRANGIQDKLYGFGRLLEDF